MKLSLVVGCGAVLAYAAGSALVACATDDSVAPTVDGGGEILPADAAPAADAGAADASDAATCTDDCEYFPTTCSANALCPVPNATPAGGPLLDLRARIFSLRGRAADDVWGVGSEGTILHFDGTEWSVSLSGTDQTLNGIWLADAGEAAMVTPAATYTRDDTALDAGKDAAPASAGGWRPALGMRPDIYYPYPVDQPAVSEQLGGLWGAPNAEWIWCATSAIYSFPPLSGLTRAHLTPKSLTSGSKEFIYDDPLFTSGCANVACDASRLKSVHGASSDDIWAVGVTGAVIHVTGAQGTKPVFTVFDSQTWTTLYGVWAASAMDVWAVGAEGVIRHFTGDATRWDVVSDVPTSANLRAVWGSSSSDIWAVGDGSVVLHYDGKAWSRVEVGALGARHPDLYTVWAPGPGHVWIGGDGILLSLGGVP